jgi:putative addiction module killer protein
LIILKDYKFIQDGVYELRFSFGSGYRVYFGIKEETIVILLHGKALLRRS